MQNYGKDIGKLEKKLKIKFKDKNLLTQAVVHRSYLNEHPNFGLEHNERLEFLGDAVLELVVTEYLYKNYKNPEGELTNWRASLVNAKMLAEVTKKLGVEEFLFLSKGEEKDTNSKARSYILANTFEAIIGAIYLDKGYLKAKNFIDRVLMVELPVILEKKLYMDPKSKFQEMAQEEYNITPTYKILDESGPDHDKHFLVGAYLKDRQVGTGEGSSKQEAQENAAKDAIVKEGWD